MPLARGRSHEARDLKKRRFALERSAFRLGARFSREGEATTQLGYGQAGACDIGWVCRRRTRRTAMSSHVTSERRAPGARRLRGAADRARRRRLRRGAQGLQRDDRQAAGADRALRGPRRRRQGRRLRPRPRPARSPSAAAATTAPGWGPCDDGVVIDLSPLKDIEVDPQARTVRVGGGCTWGEVDRATNEHGLATPSGIISTTGVGGLTLGGGLGHLTRKCGLAIDNLLEAELVLASGERVRASADENPDLYWAIRGGGGNFGVVTSFLFRLHEVGTVIAGPTFWPVEAGAEVLSVYREFLPDAPRELNGFFAFAHRAARRRRSRRRSTCARSAASSGATSAARRTRRRRWRRCWTRCPSRSCTACSRCRTRRCRARSTALPAGRPVVLARRLRQGDPRRGGRAPRPVRRRDADLEVDHAPVPDRRRRPRPRPVRHRLELPRRELGLGLRRRRPRPGQRRRDPAAGASTTTRRCTRTRPAAPT